MHKRLALAVALTVFISVSTAAAAEKCTPEFPLKNGWLGADAAYSIPLPDGRDVWIFGDTLYGDRRVVIDSEPRMVRNSIGISRCEGSQWKLDYFIRKDPVGNPMDFFQAKGPKWYWALDGFVSGDQLWVTLLCIRSAPKLTSEALGFETCGTDIAEVTNLKADPPDWDIKIFPLVPDGAKAYPSATTVVEGDYAYLFALYEEGSRPMLLTRIPLKELDENAAEHLQYLAADGTWKPGFKPSDAKVVMEHGNTEMTIRYHSGLKEWIAVMNDSDLASGKIVLRTAPALTGPWSKGQIIYRIPELKKGNPDYDKDNFCYAGKEHPEFRGKNSLLITYACNTKVVKKLESSPGIYFPKVVRVKLPNKK